MIIVIIAAIILIVGIVLCNKRNREFAGAMLTCLGACMFIACIITILATQIPAEHEYQKVLYEKEVIEYRIENQNNNVVGNELLYNDVVEFNNNLRDTKRYAASPWTNWFINAKIASIDYIEVPGLNE